MSPRRRRFNTRARSCFDYGHIATSGGPPWVINTPFSGVTFECGRCRSRVAYPLGVIGRMAVAYMQRVILERLSRTPRLGQRLYDEELRAASRPLTGDRS